MSSSSQQKDNSHRASCPCKRVPLRLSSFTAAEHGDVAALSRYGNGNRSLRSMGLIRQRHDGFGNTPLHLSAQHGHCQATAWLLQQGCPVNGIQAVSRSTPLHRASYAGAVACMRLLLQCHDCDLLLADHSFGDAMSSLHKAVSGGRYLAVQLLLDAAKERDVLSKAVQAVDAAGRTPKQLAEELHSKYQSSPEQAVDMRSSVARWDSVAGGPPNWNACLELLERAGGGSEGNQGSDEQGKLQSLSPSLPEHLRITTIAASSSLNENDDCLEMDCGCEEENGRCLTASWENAFRSVLAQSVQEGLGTASPLFRCFGRDEAPPTRSTGPFPVTGAAISGSTGGRGQISGHNKNSRGYGNNENAVSSHSNENAFSGKSKPSDSDNILTTQRISSDDSELRTTGAKNDNPSSVAAANPELCTDRKSEMGKSLRKQPQSGLGCLCQLCGQKTFVLYRNCQGQLCCKSCCRRGRHKIAAA